jgi:hypothetical protein
LSTKFLIVSSPSLFSLFVILHDHHGTKKNTTKSSSCLNKTTIESLSSVLPVSVNPHSFFDL